MLKLAVSVVVVLLLVGVALLITHHPNAVRLSPAPQATPISAGQAPTSEAQTSAPATTQNVADTSNWQTLNNKHGWSVQYPPSWQAESVGGDADKPEDAFQPILQGPKGCNERGGECGSIQLGSGWRSLDSRQAALSAKEALLEAVGDSRFILLQQGEAVLGGQPAYFVVYRMKLYGGYPNGVIFKQVETKYRNHAYFIVFNEEGKNRAVVSAINSPEGWALNPIFEAILSSFKFTA